MSTISSGTTSTTTLVHSGDTTGSLVFKTNDTGSGGTTAMTIDTSQNVGIGATPSAWGSGFTTLQVGGGAACVTGRTGTSTMYLGSNWYYDGANNKYIISDYATQYYQSSGNHVWRYASSGTAGATITALEAMRIDSSGNLLVGTTNTTSNNAGTVIFQSTSNECIRLSNSGSATVQTFYSSGTKVGSISITASATAYNTSSDYRLKENIAPMTDALATVAQLKPVTYKWKIDGSDGQGFIAHELQEVVPDCVTGAKDAVDAEGNPVYQGVDTSFLVATLVASIQELKQIVDAQATEIAELKAKVR